jgi:hypothetical protein
MRDGRKSGKDQSERRRRIQKRRRGSRWAPATRGRGAPPTFCVPAPVAAVTAFRGIVPAGRKIPARSLAACVARRRSCGHWASTLLSVAKAVPEAGLSGCVHSRTYRPHRQHRPRPWTPRQDNRRRHRPQTSARTTVAPIWSTSGPSGRSPSRQPTVLTVLTHTPPFGAAPPPIAVPTFASTRQKLCRAPLDDELGPGGSGAWRDQPPGRGHRATHARGAHPDRGA